MSRVCLVNPPARVRAERYDTANFPHMGLALLGAVARQGGYDVTIIDAKLEGLDLAATRRRVLDSRPLILGLTAMTHEIHQAHELALAVRRENPDVVIVIGGVHATALPRETLEEFSGFDLLAFGEGERTFEEILLRGERESVAGLAWRREGLVLVNAPRERETALDNLPDPDYSLFPRATSYPLMTQRGCPYECAFCMNENGRKVRYRSLERVMGELRRLVDSYAPPGAPLELEIYDESFGLDRARTRELCRLIIDAGLADRVRWTAMARVDHADEELYVMMRKSGMWQIELGIESGDQAILDSVSKGITLDKIRHAVAMARRAGLKTLGFFILAQPGDTIGSMDRTIRFAAELRLDTLSLPIMVPYPGTEIRRMAERGEGGLRILSNDWRDYNSQLGNAMELESVERRKLEVLQLKGYVLHFLLQGRWKDFLAFCLLYRAEALGFLQEVVLKKWIRRGPSSS